MFLLSCDICDRSFFVIHEAGDDSMLLPMYPGCFQRVLLLFLFANFQKRMVDWISGMWFVSKTSQGSTDRPVKLFFGLENFLSQ